MTRAGLPAGIRHAMLCAMGEFPPPSHHHGDPAASLRGCIDLHMHSSFSDGEMPPEYLVEWAAELGLKAISLTDHDTTRGLQRAIARGRELGVEVIPGCEISVKLSGGTFHLLAYFYDLNDEGFEGTLRDIADKRETRNRKIVADGELLLAAPGMMKEQRRSGVWATIRHAIRRVFLDEAAPVELHAGQRQDQTRPLPAELRPADERERLTQGRGLGQSTALQVPDAPQHAGGRVEAPAALAIGRGGEVEQSRRFVVDLDARLGAGARVDAAGEGGLAVAGIPAFEPVDLSGTGSCDGGRCLTRSGPERDRAGTAHRAELETLEAHGARDPRSGPSG